jgi:DNA-binding transcriptional LysR family regulator
VTKNIDLRLLAVVKELQRTGSVSHAAENLGLSQSAVSMNLARLRKQFRDPLFIRTSRGMEPTPYAMEVITELQKAAEILEAALEHRMHFEPSSSDRMFHLCSTDIAQFTILPPLVKRLAVVAPSIRIDLRNITEETPRLLESGEADLAIGLIPPMGSGFFQQKLFASCFMCAVRARHPRIEDKLTLKQFQNEAHLSVTTLGTGYHDIEKTLEAQKIRRNIAMRVPSFLGVAALISDTDYLAIVPQRLGQMLAEGGKMRLLPLPFPLPGYQVTQNWHERYTGDPALQWFRATLASVFQEGETGGKAAVGRDSGKRRHA